jgi:hypothetical protein
MLAVFLLAAENGPRETAVSRYLFFFFSSKKNANRFKCLSRFLLDIEQLTIFLSQNNPFNRLRHTLAAENRFNHAWRG